jgi:hypothetical protein
LGDCLLCFELAFLVDEIESALPSALEEFRDFILEFLLTLTSHDWSTIQGMDELERTA